MSLLDHPSPVRPSPSRPDTLEDAFHAWAEDPAKPDLVALGPDRHIPMLELARHLERSPTELAPAACTQLGLPAGVTIATAVTRLLHATIAPDGPRCRSFRSASYYLRSIDGLDADLPPDIRHLAASIASTASTQGHPDVH